MQASTQISNCTECPAFCNTVFCHLQKSELSKIDNARVCKTYKKGEWVFKEEHYPKGLYCVQSGKIKISQCGNDAKEQIVHLAKAGDIMGYRALLGSDSFSCSAQVMEEAQICFIPKELFLQLIESNPKLTLQIVHLLSEELKEAEKKITATAQLPVKNRIAQALRLLQKNYGLERDNKTINVAIKKSEIAQLAGTSRETATRILYNLQQQNIIVLNGKKIQIIQVDLLEKLANDAH